MLEFMRQKAQSTVIQVIIVAIILVFVFWGVGGQQGSGVNAVATVNDEPITYVRFQRTYDDRINQLRDQLGGNIPDGLLQTLGVKDQVLEGLIQRTLISQAAGEVGLMVSDKEVRDKIRNMEAFKNNGVFDVSWYKQIVAGNRMSVAEFEASMKSDMLVNKVTEQLARFGGVADSELRDRFEYDNHQKKFSYVTFTPEDFAKKVKADDKALAAFFEERKDSYRGEPQIKLKYVLFPFDETAKLDIPEEKIASYFEENRDKYVVPEQRRARHILVMIGKEDSQEAITQKREKAESILKRAREGEDFAELAKEYSEDLGSASRGGDLGFFGRGQMVKPFEEAVFGLSEGDMTLTRSDYGYHVIKLEEIKPPRLKSLDEVRDSIVAAIKAKEIKNLAFKQANSAYEQIIMSGSLEKYAESGGELKETKSFTRSKVVEPLKSNPGFKEAALKLKQGELSSLLEGINSYAIFYAEEIKQPEVPDLAEVKDRVRADFVKQRSQELAKETAEALLVALKEGATLTDEAKRLDLEVKETPFVSRAESATAGLPAAMLEAAMGLTAAVPYPDAVITSGQTLYVAAFKAEQDASDEKFAEKKDEIRKELLAENKNNILGDWLAFLRDRAEVEIDKNF